MCISYSCSTIWCGITESSPEVSTEEDERGLSACDGLEFGAVLLLLSTCSCHPSVMLCNHDQQDDEMLWLLQCFTSAVGTGQPSAVHGIASHALVVACTYQ